MLVMVPKARAARPWPAGRWLVAASHVWVHHPISLRKAGRRLGPATVLRSGIRVVPALFEEFGDDWPAIERNPRSPTRIHELDRAGHHLGSARTLSTEP